jgi:hypothetical protein
MKKLLLLIVPLLLLFGSGLGITNWFDYSITTTSHTTNSTAAGWTSFYVTQSWTILNYFLQWTYQQNCMTWKLFKSNNSSWSSHSVIATWTMSWTLWNANTGYINVAVSDWIYAIITYSGDNSSACNRSASNTLYDIYWSWPIVTSYLFNEAMGTVYYWFKSWVFLSYSYTPTSTPTTIHYNWITTSFTGTDIRLTNLFHNMITSGSDAVFQPYVYRALFRSH